MHNWSFRVPTYPSGSAGRSAFWIYNQANNELADRSIAGLAAHVAATRLGCQDLYHVEVTTSGAVQPHFDLVGGERVEGVSAEKRQVKEKTDVSALDSPSHLCWWCSSGRRRWCCGWSWRPPARSSATGRRWTRSSPRRRRPRGCPCTCLGGHCEWWRWRLVGDQSTWHQAGDLFIQFQNASPSLLTYGAGDNLGLVGSRSSNWKDRRAAAATLLAGPAGRSVSWWRETFWWSPTGSTNTTLEVKRCFTSQQKQESH